MSINLGLAVVDGVGSILKSRKRKRKERRKRKRAKAKARAEQRDNINAGFNFGEESGSEALNTVNNPQGKTEGLANNNMLMYVVGAFLVWKFLLKK